MKTTFRRTLLAIVITCLTLSLAPKLFAAPPGSGDLLVQAYTSLSMADHDYQGHRAAAMEQVEAAGKLIGVNVRGDGKGHEKQGVSDANLRNAQTLLEQARPNLGRKALRHVNKAITEISVALRIK